MYLTLTASSLPRVSAYHVRACARLAPRVLSEVNLVAAARGLKPVEARECVWPEYIFDLTAKAWGMTGNARWDFNVAVSKGDYGARLQRLYERVQELQNLGENICFFGYIDPSESAAWDADFQARGDWEARHLEKWEE